MDKNTLTGLFLIALVLIGYSYFAKPQEAQSQGTEQIQAKQRTPSTNTKPQQAIQPQKVDSSDVFYTALTDSQAARPVVLRNENVAVTLSPKGGVVSEVHLLNFKSYKDFHEQSNKNLTLFDAKTAQMEFQLETTKRSLQPPELHIPNYSKNRFICNTCTWSYNRRHPLY